MRGVRGMRGVCPYSVVGVMMPAVLEMGSTITPAMVPGSSATIVSSNICAQKRLHSSHDLQATDASTLEHSPHDLKNHIVHRTGLNPFHLFWILDVFNTQHLMVLGCKHTSQITIVGAILKHLNGGSVCLTAAGAAPGQGILGLYI